MRTDDRLPNVHPGEVIREEFMVPWDMSQYRLAQGLQMSPTAVGEIIEGKRRITPRTAARLSQFLGCSAEFWLGLQADYDLEEVWRADEQTLGRITRYEDTRQTANDPDPVAV